ncbi:ferredoxin [Promicromonospora sp. NPDC060271]|jgi:ferredoxin|uniref:ferredoxin n=1 Tax=unclassified Promicromonospora TaxID=2647929 RepID=UPI00365EDE69
MKINVDQDACCGAGQCVLLAPEVFGQDEDDRVVLLDERPGPELDFAVQEAVSMCPTGVIWVDQNA